MDSFCHNAAYAIQPTLQMNLELPNKLCPAPFLTQLLETIIT